MFDAYNRKDAELIKTQALPAAASTSTETKPIDLMKSANGHMLAACELLVTAAALAVGILPDTRTATFILQHADALDGNGDLDSPVTLADNFIVQTGAGGAGAAAVEKRLRLPTDVKRYVNLKCTFGASTNDGSAVDMELALVF